MENTTNIQFEYTTKSKSLMGYENSQVENFFTNHIHNGFEIIYVIKGDLTYGTDSFVKQIKSNTLIITPKHSYHYILSDNGKIYERVIVSVNDKQLNELLSQKFGQEHIILNISEQGFLKSLFLKFPHYNDLKKKVPSAYYEKIIQNIIEEICINTVLIDTESLNNVVSIYDPIFLNIISFIKDNIATINVNAIAQKFNISTSYVYKLFQKFVKISPQKYIIEKKLSYAKSLIDEGEKMTNIAYKCGYSEYSSFYRLLKKYYKENH